jgi:hypothetical protein
MTTPYSPVLERALRQSLAHIENLEHTLVAAAA